MVFINIKCQLVFINNGEKRSSTLRLSWATYGRRGTRAQKNSDNLYRVFNSDRNQIKSRSLHLWKPTPFETRFIDNVNTTKVHRRTKKMLQSLHRWKFCTYIHAGTIRWINVEMKFRTTSRHYFNYISTLFQCQMRAGMCLRIRIEPFCTKSCPFRL